MVASAKTLDQGDTRPVPSPAEPSPGSAQPSGEGAPGKSGAHPRPRSGKGRWVLAIVGALGLAVGGYVWSRRGDVSTEDAQIDAQVLSIPAQAAGTVARVLFTDNQEIHAGDLLVELDDATARARVQSAQASLAAARAAADAADADVALAKTNGTGNRDVAKAAFSAAAAGAAAAADQIKEAEAAAASSEIARKQAQRDVERARALHEGGALSQAEADRAETSLALATSNLDVAQARVRTLKLAAAQAQGHVAEAHARAEQSSDVESLLSQALARAKAARAQIDAAEAALALAEIDLAHTKVFAPSDGRLSKKSVVVGQFVAMGQPIAQLVPALVWVTANFKETQLAALRAGQPADIEVDAYGAEVHGEIESFSGATGSRFALLPPDNASGNYTKVVQRVPVRIKVTESALALLPGMSVEVTVHTR